MINAFAHVTPIQDEIPSLYLELDTLNDQFFQSTCTLEKDFLALLIEAYNYSVDLLGVMIKAECGYVASNMKTTGVPPGTYMVRVNDGKQIQVGKLIIN